MDKKPFILSLIISSSCCYENHTISSLINNTEIPFQITTKTYTNNSLSFAEIFTEGSSVGLFIMKESERNLHKGSLLYENIRFRATLSATGGIYWAQYSDIYLKSDQSVLVFAYYPYQPQMDLNPNSIPVNILPIASETPEYKYGSLSQGHKAVNGICPIAKLSMKHALSLLSFELYLDNNIDKEYLLTSIQVGNNAGEKTLSLKGTMNIITGMIDGIPSPYGATRLTLDSAEALRNRSAKEYSIRIIPTNVPIEKKAIEFTFMINMKTYTYEIPKGTHWKKGNKYQYKFIFTGNEIKLGSMTSHTWFVSEQET